MAEGGRERAGKAGRKGGDERGRGGDELLADMRAPTPGRSCCPLLSDYLFVHRFVVGPQLLYQLVLALGPLGHPLHLGTQLLDLAELRLGVTLGVALRPSQLSQRVHQLRPPLLPLLAQRQNPLRA